jgi:pyrroline-5-carboxylate reductase
MMSLSFEFSPEQPLVLVGAGKMGGALLAGWLQRGLDAKSVVVIDPSPPPDSAAMLVKAGILSTAMPPSVAARLIVIAVKPQIIAGVLPDLQRMIGPATIVLSIAAGATLANLEAGLGSAAIVRSMPNTPSHVREGVTAVAYEESLPAQDAAAARTLFESIGLVVRVEERWLDAVTGLSGSGPAYVYVLIEALADGGVKMGLPRDTAQLLAAQTVSGAARLLLDSHEHAGVLKDRVASPGGTSIAGLHELERGGLRAALLSAVEAAAQRSHELGTVL